VGERGLRCVGLKVGRPIIADDVTRVERPAILVRIRELFYTGDKRRRYVDIDNIFESGLPGIVGCHNVPKVVVHGCPILGGLYYGDRHAIN
jgi:hypothetical protein